MKKNFVFLFLFPLSFSVYSQFNCGTTDTSPIERSIGCTDFNNYSPYENYVPIKTVSVTFHVIQDEDGTNNFQNVTADRNWIEDIILWNMNYRMMHLLPMNLVTSPPSPDIEDSRIRFELNGIYFHSFSSEEDPDDISSTEYNYWQLNTYSELYYKFYQYHIVDNTDIVNRDKTLHIILVDGAGANGHGPFGQRYLTYSAAYDLYLTNNWWWPRNGILHEFGHNCRLSHSWETSEVLDDTPSNCNCWNYLEPACRPPGCPYTSTCNLPTDCFCADPINCEEFSNNMMDYNAGQEALTRQQLGVMHYTLSSFAGYQISNAVIPNCTINANDYVVPTSQTVTFNDTKYFDANIVVENGATLILNCTLFMPDDATITVEDGGSLILNEGAVIKGFCNGDNFNGDIIINGALSMGLSSSILMGDGSFIIKQGGRLIIDGGILTTSSDNLWQGIEVWGDATKTQYPVNGQFLQGRVELKNGAVIENALVGIKVFEPDVNGHVAPGTTGGIVNANDAIFRNNKIAVRFEPYDNFYPDVSHPRINLSSFKNCTFETISQLNDNTQYPFAFVMLNGVNGIDFLGNTFQNTTTNTLQESEVTKRGIGIRSINSGYNVIAYCISNTPQCTQYDKNEFSGLFYGIYAQNNSSMYPISVIRSNFLNNNRGIIMSGVNYPAITLNEFNVGATEYVTGGIEPPPPDKSTTMVFTSYGLYLHNIQLFNVQENEFYSDDNGYCGSLVWKSGITGKELYNNTYHDLNVGSLSSGYNEGLQIKCNHFTGNISLTDIGITSGTVGDHQGKCILNYIKAPAGNTFSFTNYQIMANTGVTSFQYNHHSSNETTPSYYTAGIVFPHACTPYYTSEACPSRLGTGSTTTQLLANITTLNNELTALNSNIDGGNTQAMLDKVNSNLSSAQLKNELLTTASLSDTVMIATLTRTQPLKPGHIKEILVPNSPLTDNVIKVLNQQTLPPGIKNEIQAVQTGESQRSVFEQQITAIEAERTLAVSELIQLYAEDTTGTGPANIIAFLETQPDKLSKQMLVQEYSSAGKCSEAQTILGQLPEISQDEKDFYTLYSILVDLCSAGSTVYDLSEEQKQTVETLALSNSIVSANAQAIMSQVYGEWYWEKIEELLDFNTVTLKGTLFGNPECDNAPVPNDTILLVDEYGETVIGVNPVITNENGEFIFSPNELTLLDTTANYTLKTKSGYALSEVPVQTISEWIGQSPFSLTLTNVNLEWYDFYDSPDSLLSIGTKIDISGNIYVAGRTSRMVSNDDVILIKYTPQGVRLWETIYDSGINGYDNANDMVTDGNGNCFLSLTSLNTNVVLLKYNTNGQLVWSKSINNTANNRYYAIKVKLTVTGNIYLT